MMTPQKFNLHAFIFALVFVITIYTVAVHSFFSFAGFCNSALTLFLGYKMWVMWEELKVTLAASKTKESKEKEEPNEGTK